MSREHQVAPGAAPNRTADRHSTSEQYGGLPPGGLLPSSNRAVTALLAPPRGRALEEAAQFNVIRLGPGLRLVYDWLAPRWTGPAPAPDSPTEHEEWVPAIWAHQRLAGCAATGRIDTPLVTEVAAALMATDEDVALAVSLLVRHHQDVPFLELGLDLDKDSVLAARRRVDGPYFITDWGTGGDLALTLNRVPHLPYEVTEFVDEARGLATDRHLDPSPPLAVIEAATRNVYFLGDRTGLLTAIDYFGVADDPPGSGLERVTRSIADRQRSEGREATGVVDEEIALGLSLLMFRNGLIQRSVDIVLTATGSDPVRVWDHVEPPPDHRRVPVPGARTEWIEAFAAPDGGRLYWCRRLPATLGEVRALFLDLSLVTAIAM